MDEPTAFLVMPFDAKDTGIVKEGVPARVDFDALWERIYDPILRDIGYAPVRADQDVGALIITEMIQRLALADLVVADVTLPNANVYYEIGVRHAAQRRGCVLVAAEWAQPVFDLAQMRQLRFPLADGSIGDVTARSARAALASGLKPLVDGTSPVFDAVPGYPGEVDAGRISAFKEVVAELSAFDADVRAVRLAPSGERRARAEALRDERGHKPVVRETVVLSLIRLLRDEVGWQAVLDYIETLPPDIARHPSVVEQKSLAIGKSGDPARAAGALEEFIKIGGPTPERLGLLGGRYKQLWRQATTASDRARYLDLAIGSYKQGMMLDLNEYYCASNLARLYRARGIEEDEQRASDALLMLVAAVRRGIGRGTADEWARPTLLGAAFDRGDVPEAKRLLGEIEREGAEAWKLEATIADLRESVANQQDSGVREQLDGVLSNLTDLLPSAQPTSPEDGS
jgi:hypothetical protein